MKTPIYQIDTFSSKIFGGNPAAVCPLDSWLSNDILQNIAEENNLSETAFFVEENGEFHIRWFTPSVEVDLCGHATLASAFVIFNIIGHTNNKIIFHSKSGDLSVYQDKDWLVMDFPSTPPIACDAPSEIIEAFGIEPIEVLKSNDYIVVFENENEILSLSPNLSFLENIDGRGVIITSKGKNSDFVSRFFAPKCGVNEDPVCGSAHCSLTPYWAKKLNKNKLAARQLSNRGGLLRCELIDNRVLISGQAIMYLEGTLHV